MKREAEQIERSIARMLVVMVLIATIGAVIEATMDEGTGFILGMVCGGAFAAWVALTAMGAQR